MSGKTDLTRLVQQVQKAGALVRESAVKVEELGASMEEIFRTKERVVLFPDKKKPDDAAPKKRLPNASEIWDSLNAA